MSINTCGPNFSQISDQYLKGRISKQTFERVRDEYIQLHARFDAFTKTPEHKVFAADHGEMRLREENIIYYDDQWYILEF
jgi:hypothetical protein